MLSRRRSQRGFTLIEIMISLTVLGILLMVALPSFSEWLQNQQLRAASEATLNGLQVARGAAIRRNVLVQFRQSALTAFQSCRCLCPARRFRPAPAVAV